MNANTQSHRKPYEWPLLLCLLLVAFWFRTYRLAEVPPGVHHDDIKNVLLVEKILDGYWRVYYPENLTIGDNVDIGFGTFIQAEHGVYIGDNAKIGGGCMIYSKNTINGTKGQVIIGENSTIGANSVLLPGAVVRSGEHIKALSVVT